MKKYIFLILIGFFLITNPTYSFDIQETTKTVLSNIDTTISKLGNIIPDSVNINMPDTLISEDFKGAAGIFYNDVKQALSVLAKGLGTSVEFVWDILVKQQIVIACSLLIGLIFLIILWFKAMKMKVENFHEDYLKIIFKVVTTIALIVYNSKFIITMFTGFINPEYGAIKEILTIIERYQ